MRKLWAATRMSSTLMLIENLRNCNCLYYNRQDSFNYVIKLFC